MKKSTAIGSRQRQWSVGSFGWGPLGCLVALLALLTGCPPRTGLNPPCPDGATCDKTPAEPDPGEGAADPDGTHIPLWQLLFGSGDDKKDGGNAPPEPAKKEPKSMWIPDPTDGPPPHWTEPSLKGG